MNLHTFTYIFSAAKRGASIMLRGLHYAPGYASIVGVGQARVVNHTLATALEKSLVSRVIGTCVLLPPVGTITGRVGTGY